MNANPMDTELSILSELEYCPLISVRSQIFPSDDFSIYRIGINLNQIVELNGLKHSLYNLASSVSGQIRPIETSHLFAFFLRDNCWIRKFRPLKEPSPTTTMSLFAICVLQLRSDVKLYVETPKERERLQVNHPTVLRPADFVFGEWEDQGDYSKHTIVAGLWV
jgi:hypothetical protein